MARKKSLAQIVEQESRVGVAWKNRAYKRGGYEAAEKAAEQVKGTFKYYINGTKYTPVKKLFDEANALQDDSDRRFRNGTISREERKNVHQRIVELRQRAMLIPIPRNVYMGIVNG